MTKRCLGCMKIYSQEFEVCPHCGYIEGAPAEDTIHIEPGTLLHNRYVIGKVIGLGDFGITYIGWDDKLEQKVAIKEYLPSEFSTRISNQLKITVSGGVKGEQFNAGLEKFVEEAKRLAKFQNEAGIVKIFDSFTENGTAYIVMEFLDGETLADKIAIGTKYSEEDTIAMLLPLMNSLQAVHNEGILHRAVTPNNIFITKNGEVKLIDFSTARYATTTYSRSLTVIIKRGYSPEEQYRSRGDQGTHTDVYSLAAVMYTMITGVTPPDALERRASIETKKKDLLQDIRKIKRNVSRNIENAILNAMNVQIEDRTQTVSQFIEELNANPPAKRRYGKIKKIDIYKWPLWLKVSVVTVFFALVAATVLLVTGVIDFPSLFSDEIVVPEGFVVVPDIEGEEKDDALSILEKYNLIPSPDGNIESEYIEAGKIVLQTPQGGTYLKENDKVSLLVSSGAGVQNAVNGISTVPYVIWDNQEDAIAKLKKAGLAEPKIEYEFDENVGEGKVISQSIQSGEKVDEKTEITIIVSKGSKGFVMPNVEGENIENAQATLLSLGLSVSIEYIQDDDFKEDTVISQSVSSGNNVKKGTEVTLVVSSGKKVITVPNVVSQNYQKAEQELKNEGFNVRILENYSNKVTAGNVISQSPAAGSGQFKGSEIVIVVSKGKQPVNVVLDANGGNVSNTNKTVYYSSTYGDLPNPTKTGYKFLGWFTEKNSGVKIDKTTTVISNNEHTLFAHWSVNSYTVSFDGNGSADKLNSIKVTFDGAYGILPNIQKKGYDFDGWYTEKTNGSKVTKNTIVKTASSHTLYAHWSAKSYTVSFDPNGGSVSQKNISVKYGSQYGVLPTPTRDYYDFIGWYTSTGGDTKVSSSTIMSDSNTTIYARWKLKDKSGWVLESSVPQGAQIVDTKWTYTKTETTTSTTSNLSGWTQTGSYWKQTGSGSFEYASFPTGFDTSHSIYTGMQKAPATSYDNGSTKRVVSNSSTGYVYWHWMYNVAYANRTDRPVSGKKGTFRVNSNGDKYGFNYFSAFKSSVNCPYLDSSYCCNQGLAGYNCSSVMPQAEKNRKGGGTPRYFRFNYYTCSYTDYQKVYNYKKVTNNVESFTAVSNGGQISNVQKYVQYREK